MALDMLMNEAKGMSDGALMEVVHFMPPKAKAAVES